MAFGHNFHWLFGFVNSSCPTSIHFYMYYMESVGPDSCLTLLVPLKVFSGVACMRRPGTSADRRTGAGSAGQIQCAGQKVDKLKSSPSFLLNLLSALRSLTKLTSLRYLHLVPCRKLWLTLRPENSTLLISKASPSLGSDARARAAPWESRQPRPLCVTREKDCEMSSDGPSKAKSKSSKI